MIQYECRYGKRAELPDDYKPEVAAPSKGDDKSKTTEETKAPAEDGATAAPTKDEAKKDDSKGDASKGGDKEKSDDKGKNAEETKAPAEDGASAAPTKAQTEKGESKGDKEKSD